MTAFWDKLTGEKQAEEAAKKDNKKVAKSDKKTAKAKKSARMVKEKAQLFNDVLIRPVVSENAMNQQLAGKYVFEVSQRTNKNEITKAVEARYGVDVTSVNVVCYKPKRRGFRTTVGMMKGIKKAIVTLKQGEKIELFKEA